MGISPLTSSDCVRTGEGSPRVRDRVPPRDLLTGDRVRNRESLAFGSSLRGGGIPPE